MNIHNLYVLVEPTTRKIRYVGQTIYPLQERLNQHIRHTKAKSQPNRHVNYWINSLLKENRRPIIRFVCFRNTQQEIDEAEKTAIARLKAKGYNLCNLTGGGDGTFKMSEETRKKMSQSKLGEKNSFYGKTHTEETRKLLSNQRKGKKLDELHRAIACQILDLYRGGKHTEATKEKISKANQGLGAKHWKFVDPNGQVVEIYNLNQFCIENGLFIGNMCRVNSGHQKSSHGWTRFIEQN